MDDNSPNNYFFQIGNEKQLFILIFSHSFSQQRAYISFLLAQTVLEMDKNPIVYLHKVCPFAQRVWLVLEEIKLQYTIRQTSFISVEKSFAQLYKNSLGHDPNSQGKVPVIIVEGVALAQSSLICWYLAQKYKGNHLIPTQDLEKFRMRLFIKNNTKIIELFYRFRGFKENSPQRKKKLMIDFEKTAQKLNESLVLPYAMGKHFTLADVMIIPWIIRWNYVDKFAGIGIQKKYSKILEWLSNCETRQSVKLTSQALGEYSEYYKTYFDTTVPVKSLKAKL